VQELRQWQREWREENRAKTFGFVGDRRTSADDKPSTPPPDVPNTTSVDDSTAELSHAEDTEDKVDEKDIQHADDITSSDNTWLVDSTCCC